MLTFTRRRLAAVALVAATALLGTTACGGGDDAAADGPITLTVDVFGQFGYADLYQEYMASHPGVKIVERGTGGNLDEYSPKLTQWLAAGKGAGDVVAIEEGLLVEYKANPQNFVNLLDHGAADLKGNFLDWKWNQGLTADGKQLIGLGTDVGGMAMCYRKDLFAKAGLPTDRDAVSKLWPTWQDYIKVGEQFTAKKTGASFLDAATNTFNTILLQTAGNSSGYSYYDTGNNLVVGSNPAVKQAYDTTMDIIDSGLSGKYGSWSEEWVSAFKQSKFATIACPAWMTGVIEGNAGAAAKGKWDIAQIPGNGGNWGGSFLAVPKQSKHQAEAIELAKFLTSAKGQIGAFKAKGPLPSSPQALEDPAIIDSKNAYFSEAPVGKIFAEGAKSLKPVYMGPKNQAVRTEVENAVRSVELGKRSPEQGWTDAVANAEKAAAK
ncbi:extracellular solute-binding protein [Micromonospora aurantiaca]|uniref:Extracellular solute-binding protein n=1 Tax=Micromonospora aurantiaca (nom. illeg.) TaxID=47850 RepID=A0A1C6TG74_9ACTN|nr:MULTISPECIES: extracellular solute-binding protein [Micromonospora]ADL49190.1 extracellular solute-binding protein family 1 [Micromonospora aurantiaca ATCC 27029]AXH89361.1 extracellular solute-binding protein [Micromonospora aurantiaca]KAB1108389.1 extracellular solute-binding protein [Micromonospora aurantiaca]MBC9003895.1 extracellular solute-binding protein [Micromonospora aurantiaca]OHX05455.1 ABC transporter substrate-binding protein [Micromonospora sp. WMMB235]